MSFITLRNLTQDFGTGEPILNDINLNLELGKLYVITGLSGSGKTTLLKLIGGMLDPDYGVIEYEGRASGRRERDRWHRENTVYMPCEVRLAEFLTAREYLGVICGESGVECLRQLGLTEDEMDRNVKRLSDGQRQRVAMARLATAPERLILADDPTSHLHHDCIVQVIAMLKEHCEKENRCGVITTSSWTVAAQVDYTYDIDEGEITLTPFRDSNVNSLKFLREERMRLRHKKLLEERRKRQK